MSDRQAIIKFYMGEKNPRTTKSGRSLEPHTVALVSFVSLEPHNPETKFVRREAWISNMPPNLSVCGRRLKLPTLQISELERPRVASLRPMTFQECEDTPLYQKFSRWRLRSKLLEKHFVESLSHQERQLAPRQVEANAYLPTRWWLILFFPFFLWQGLASCMNDWLMYGGECAQQAFS